MATLTVRNLDENVKARLRVRAAENGRSMEAEARAILGRSLEESSRGEGIGTRIHRRFATLGGAELELPPREDRLSPADFDG